MGLLECKTGQDVGSQTDTKANNGTDREKGAHLFQLLSQLIHCRIVEVRGQSGCSFLLTGRVHVQDGEAVQQQLHVRTGEKGLVVCDMVESEVRVREDHGSRRSRPVI